jgi:hypothetical protein
MVYLLCSQVYGYPLLLIFNHTPPDYSHSTHTDSVHPPDIHLPENDRVRYTIHPDARKEILKRLLELNHKIHAEEVAAGLWEKKKTTAKKGSKPKLYETKVDVSVLSEPKIEFE